MIQARTKVCDRDLINFLILQKMERLHQLRNNSMLYHAIKFDFNLINRKNAQSILF